MLSTTIYSAEKALIGSMNEKKVSFISECSAYAIKLSDGFSKCYRLAGDFRLHFCCRKLTVDTGRWISRVRRSDVRQRDSSFKATTSDA